MGQQQLLLVILVTIIVGIATVVAINTFGSAADSANVDAVRQDITQMAAAAQGYYMKPGSMGGGGHDFTQISWDDMGAVACDQTTSGTTGPVTGCENENGEYHISGGGTDSFTITGVPTQASGTVTATVNSNGISDMTYDETASYGG